MISRLPFAEASDGKKPLTALAGIAAASAVLLQASSEGSLLAGQPVISVASFTLGLSGIAFFAGWQVGHVERDGAFNQDLRALTSWSWRKVGWVCGFALPLCLLILGYSLVLAISTEATIWFLIPIGVAINAITILTLAGRIVLSVEQVWRAVRNELGRAKRQSI
jgi:hypothetical protein